MKGMINLTIFLWFYNLDSKIWLCQRIMFHFWEFISLFYRIYHIYQRIAFIPVKNCKLYVSIILEPNQNKNNCLVRNFLDKLKSPALFSHLFRTEKSAGNFNLSKKLRTRQLVLFWFASKIDHLIKLSISYFALYINNWVHCRSCLTNAQFHYSICSDALLRLREK